MLHQQVKFASAYETCAVVQMVGKFKQHFFDINLFIFQKEMEAVIGQGH